MKILLDILAIVVFIGGAYFMGNKILGTFDEDWEAQVWASFLWNPVMVRYWYCGTILCRNNHRNK